MRRVVAAALIALACPARAQFVQPEGSRFHNGSTVLLADDGRAAPVLQKLQAAVDRLDVDETLSLLAVLRAIPEPELLPWGTRLHVPALERAARLVLEAGRQAVAEAVAASERAVLARAAGERDLPVLLDRASRGASLPTAREAALLAARLLFEEGRFDDAAGLAARARDVPGAAELLAAARHHEPPPAAAPDLGPRGLQPQNAGSLSTISWGSFDRPFVASLPGDRLLVLGGDGLRVLDRATRNQLFPLLNLRRSLQAVSARPVFELAPVHHLAVRAGDRWVLPLDALTRPLGKGDPAGKPRAAFLAAVDIGADVKLSWAVPLPGPPEVSSACGPPLVHGGRVYAQVFRTDLATQVSLACLDLSDGRMLWETPLASATQVPAWSVRWPDPDEDTRPVDVAPAAREGVIWCCTGYGVVAAVDALTGTPLFVFRYDRVYPEDLGTWDPAFLYETGGWEDEPVRFWGERVVVAPRDSRFLYMLASEPGPRGQLILDDPIEKLDRTGVVGLRPDPQGRPSPAVLCTRRSGGRDGGSDGLVLLGPDGHVLEIGQPFPAGQTLLGRPLESGDRILLPTTAGLLDASATDLAAAPRLCPSLEGVPEAVMAVLPLDVGAVTVSPPTQPLPSFWVMQWHQPAP